MALLMFRTFGVIIVSFIVLIMYVLHRKKNGKFIKRKAVNEEEKIKHQKWEKIINVMAVVGLLILDRKSTRLNSSHYQQSRMPSSA